MQTDAPITESSTVEALVPATDAEVSAYLKRDGQSEQPAAAEPAKPDSATESAAPKEEAKQPEPDAGQKGRGIDKRIKELKELLAATKDVRAAKRAEPEAQPAKAEGLKSPKLADYDDYDGYEAAQASYTKKLAEEIADARLKAWKDEQAGDKARAAWDERATKAGVDPKQLTEAAATYAALVEAGEMPAFSQTMVEALNDPATEAGPSVALHLLDNPSEVERIAGLSLVGQVRELDKLAGRFKGEPIKQASTMTVGRVVPKISAASAPVPELGGGSASDPVADALQSGDFRAYERAMRKQSA